MNILVSLDSNYLKPLRVMLKSLFLNNVNEEFCIYLMHTSLLPEEIEDLKRYISANKSRLEVIYVDENYFHDAPVPFHYTKEMYFRLLAFQLLPHDLKRILYLDPDILVINPIRELYDTEFDGYMFAAAYHDKLSLKELNKIRLFPYSIDAYYNSGVLLMNLESLRQNVDAQDIFKFVEENRPKLIMPDQDILNALFAKQIKTIDGKKYNYDARYYHYYKLARNGLYDMDHIIYNTVIIHFCGKKKPWHKKYTGKFHSLYKHYEKLAFS